MPFTKVRDINLYYERHGRGPRLLYISGTGGDLRNQPRVFDGPLAAHFDLLSYDQRGLGQTEAPESPYTMAGYGDDPAALLDHIGWDKCFVMGVSFGGMVAQELALRHPERVERLVLACTSSGGAGGSSYALHELQDLPADQRAVRQIPIHDRRRDAAWQAANPDTVKQIVDTAVAADRARKADPARERGYLGQLAARAGHDTYDRLPSLAMPVFLCGGLYDGQAPPENMQVLQERISGARLEFFEGGHGFLREDPHAYERVLAFLQGKLDE